MFTLLIPTRNRQESLCHTLSFLDTFYPGTKVIVADGSAPENELAVKAACASVSNLEVGYLHFDPDITYAGRILLALHQIDSKFVAMGADDDFPLVDRLTTCCEFMAQNPDYTLATGALMGLHYESEESYITTTHVICSIDFRNPVRRLRAYAALKFATSYGVST